MLRFNLTNLIEDYLSLADHLILLQSFFGIEEEDFPTLRNEIDSNRLMYYLPASLQAVDKKKLNDLLLGKIKPSTNDEQLFIQLEDFIANPTKADFDVYSFEEIKALHQKLFSNLPKTFEAGQIRKVDESANSLPQKSLDKYIEFF